MGDTAIASIVVALFGLVTAVGGAWYLQRKQGDATIVDSAGEFSVKLMSRLDKVEAKNAELEAENKRLNAELSAMRITWQVRWMKMEQHIESLERALDSEGLHVPERPTIE